MVVLDDRSLRWVFQQRDDMEPFEAGGKVSGRQGGVGVEEM